MKTTPATISRSNKQHQRAGRSRHLVCYLTSILVLAVFGWVNLRALHLAVNCQSQDGDSHGHDFLSDSKITAAAAAAAANNNNNNNNNKKRSGHLDDHWQAMEDNLLYLWNTLPFPRVNDTDNDHMHTNYRQLANLVMRQRAAQKEDVTLVAHGSVSRLFHLVEQSSRWGGPISFALYLASTQDIVQFTTFLHNANTSSAKSFWNNTSIHAILERHQGQLLYPVNLLRNTAQRHIESNYFLLLDADFIPSDGAYDYLTSLLENDCFWAKLRNNTVFVLPAFERFPLEENGTVTPDLVPRNPKELQQMLKDGVLSTFHSYFPPGHLPTNYSKWFTPNDDMGDVSGKCERVSYSIEYKKRFEPYVVAYKRGLPEFWDGFRGFGYNAATWCWELQLAGYHYEVLHNDKEGYGHFVVHMNHPGRNERAIEHGSVAQIQLRRFHRYVSRKYNVSQQELRYWKGRRYGEHGTHVTAQP